MQAMYVAASLVTVAAAALAYWMYHKKSSYKKTSIPRIR